MNGLNAVVSFRLILTVSNQVFYNGNKTTNSYDIIPTQHLHAGKTGNTPSWEVDIFLSLKRFARLCWNHKCCAIILGIREKRSARTKKNLPYVD